MIKEDYVSSPTARLLRDKGFDVPCRAYYDMGALKEDMAVARDWSHSNYIDHISAPTFQMAMKWLRKVHNICISVDVKIGGGKYYVCISSTENGLSHGVLEDEVWDTFEEACEESIKYCLENLL